MTREEQIIKIGAQFAIDETDGQTSGRAASMRSVLLSAFRAGAHWADQHPHWIPVEEELPEKEEDNPSLSVNVIVTDGNSVFESYYSFNTHIWAGTDIYGTITHWMPLPKAPRKEE